MENYTQASAGQLAGYQGASQTPVAPTLVGALSRMEELNKRLCVLNNQTVEVAQAVGGPFPAADAGGKNPSPQSAMQRLNDLVSEAHTTVSQIEQAMGAVRRSLGG